MMERDFEEASGALRSRPRPHEENAQNSINAASENNKASENNSNLISPVSQEKNNVASAAWNAEDKQKSLDLLHWSDMPRHLQFNPYIFTGYRPLLSIWGCIHSLFYIHNETINIITHGETFIQYST